MISPILHTYFNRLSVIALIGVACIASSGCHVISKAAYSLGAMLDPNHRECIDHVGNCALCGDPPSPTIPGGVVAASHACPACGGPGLPPPELMAQLEQMRTDTDACQQQLHELNEELAQRGHLLVQTRAELTRVQNDVLNLRTNVSQWQSSMQHLHQQIRQREAERLAMLNSMSQTLEQIVRDNQR